MRKHELKKKNNKVNAIGSVYNVHSCTAYTTGTVQYLPLSVESPFFVVAALPMLAVVNFL